MFWDHVNEYIPIRELTLSIEESPVRCGRLVVLLCFSVVLLVLEKLSRLIVSISRINKANASSKLIQTIFSFHINQSNGYLRHSGKIYMNFRAFYNPELEENKKNILSI